MDILNTKPITLCLSNSNAVNRIVASSVLSKAISSSIVLFGEIQLFMSIGISCRVLFVRKDFEALQEIKLNIYIPLNTEWYL